MYQTILIPVDGSPLSERALPYARVIAKTNKSRLILLRVIAGSPTDDTFGEIDCRPTIETYLHNLAASLDDSTSIETTVVVGDAAQAILSEAARTGTDLIVMSTHGRSGIGRWIYGSVADAVMRQTTVPILLIPATCSRVWTPGEPGRILVPLDGSQLGEAVLGPASDLAQAMSAELVLLRVVELHPMVFMGPPGFVMVTPEPELESARAYLEGISQRVRSRVANVRAVDELGLPLSRIVDVARDQQADLVALSSHGNGGLTRLVMGSVATGVVQSAGVPVLVVRPVDAARGTSVRIGGTKNSVAEKGLEGARDDSS
ncbi:MAG TPA: universal stress protein, partial [Chloroflexota bacterium]|nr:universal stress protein [Chloroflexota bacterium]